MKKKCLGRTGLMVTENSFGALPIQRISDSEAAGLLRYAYDRGVNFFDTARAYSDSEHKIGLGLADVRENIILATKTMARTREAALADLETSLANLKTDHVDIWQLHCIPELPDPNDPDSAYQALVEARRQGKTRFIGVTAHRIDVAIAGLNAARRRDNYTGDGMLILYIGPKGYEWVPQEDIKARCEELGFKYPN